MNTSESVGETSSNSCRRQENGDSTAECERPLKKARFAWQVKGKSHLKNETSENRSISNIDEINQNEVPVENTSSSSEYVNVEGEIVDNERNLEILGDYFLNHEFKTVTESEDSLDNSSLTETSIFSNNITTTRNDNHTNGNSNNSCRSSVNNLKIYVDDELLARWQSKQVAKCYIENTINRLLDASILVSPEIGYYEFNDRNQRDNDTVENEGILMAISAHGLQNQKNSSDDSINSETSHSSSFVMVSTRSTPIKDNDREHNLTGENDETEHSNEINMSLLYSDKIQHGINNKPDASSLSSQSYNENIQYSNEWGQDNVDIISNHHFMDTAVGHAIQSKGLTSSGIDR